jgi:hypothetical protein
MEKLIRMDIGKVDFCLVRCPSSHDFPYGLYGMLCPDQAEDEMLAQL